MVSGRVSLGFRVNVRLSLSLLKTSRTMQIRPPSPQRW